jgi:crotonobetainyl-CoA:carnitine CoA-transferase CaiB-like acyl-CoA transferase
MTLLSGLRIIDATYGTAGPLLTQLLADLGPDMVRIDTPGDRARGQQGHQVRLRGRRSILLDYSRPGAADLLERLVAKADVLVTEPGLDGRHPLPWTWPELERMNPRLVHCRITGYGDEGPMADAWAHDHLVAARYGVYDQPGWRDGPTYLTAPVPSLGAALLGFQAIGSALFVREKTGRGQEVTTSLLAGALAYQPGMIRAEVDRPIADTGLVARSPLGAAPFYSIYECADGNWLHFGCLTLQFQQRAMRAIGLEEELTALGFGQGRQASPETREQVVTLIAKRMKEKPYAEWAAIFEAQDIPHAPSQWTEDLLDDPQVRHEGLVIEVDDPVAGVMEQMGAPFTFSAAPYVQPTAEPVVGAHTEAICREAGLSEEDVASLRRTGALP